MLSFSRVDLDPHVGIPLDERTGGFGSELVPLPGSTRVLGSLPARSSAVPWFVADLATGEVVRRKSMRGEVRDALLDPDGGWLLTTTAVGRLELPAATAVWSRPEQFSQDSDHLLPLDEAHMAVSSTSRDTLAVLARDDGRHVRRLRVASVQAVQQRAPGVVRLLSPHQSRATTLDVGAMRVLGREPLPLGTPPLLDGDRLLLLTGERRRLRLTSGPGIEEAWRVAPDALTVLDAGTLAVLDQGRSVPGSRAVLGVDAQGLVVVATASGIALHAGTSGLPCVGLCTLADGGDLGGAVWSPEAQAVAVLDHRTEPRTLHVVRWSGTPEPVEVPRRWLERLLRR